MKDYILEAFTNTESGLNGELNNLTVKCLNSKDNKFSLDCEGNLIVNSVTTRNSSSSLGLTFDDIYPVGSYYETSDVDFNPNVSWQGTWVEDTQGRVTVAQDSTQGEFSTINATGGEKEHYLTRDEMPNHFHRSNTGDPGSYKGWGERVGWGIQSEYINNGGRFDTDTAGNDQAHNNLQPYVVVKRWHRTA